MLTLAENVTKEALKAALELQAVITKSLSERVLTRLRREPLIVSDDEASGAFKICGVPGIPLEYIQNEYEDLGETVFDCATGRTGRKRDRLKSWPIATRKYTLLN